jgi:hypothetical protein
VVNYQPQSQQQQNYNNFNGHHQLGQQQQQQGMGDMGALANSMGGLSVTQQGFNKLWVNINSAEHRNQNQIRNDTVVIIV